jgi:Spy/CpxP family protein refolding chaperone
MMKKTTWALAWMAVLALSVPMAMAQGRQGGGGSDNPMGMLRVLRSLDLSDSQRDAVQALADEFRPRVHEAQNLVKELGDELRATAEESGFNEALLRPTAEAKGAAMAEVTLLNLELRSRIHEVLTPEQLDTIENLRHQRDRKRK